MVYNKNMEEKSLIYPFNRDNIENSPESCGVILLRNTPVNGDIISIESSSNIKKDLLSRLDEGIDGVKYFDWYPANTLEEAEMMKEELVKRYHLEDVYSG